MSTRDAEGPGVCTSEVRIVENVDGTGDKKFRGYHNVRCRDILGGLSEGLPDFKLF